MECHIWLCAARYADAMHVDGSVWHEAMLVVCSFELAADLIIRCLAQLEFNVGMSGSEHVAILERHIYVVVKEICSNLGHRVVPVGKRRILLFRVLPEKIGQLGYLAMRWRMRKIGGCGLLDFLCEIVHAAILCADNEKGHCFQ